jgi:acyl-coenzyme A thioesterase PaaI-like protein
LHAGSIVTLADTIAGYACLYNLPMLAKSFTTIELKYKTSLVQQKAVL